MSTLVRCHTRQKVVPQLSGVKGTQYPMPYLHFILDVKPSVYHMKKSELAEEKWELVEEIYMNMINRHDKTKKVKVISVLPNLITKQYYANICGGIWFKSQQNTHGQNCNNTTERSNCCQLQEHIL